MKVDPPQPTASVSANDAETDIAIVGMACRFPGANTVEAFWQNIARGIESITHFSDEDLLRSGVDQSLLKNPIYVRAAPVLEEVAAFDAAYFGYSPAEAKAMDPQHRILLELAHETLEIAGCNPESYRGRIGVFTGSAMNTYFMTNGQSSRFADDYIPTLIGNDKDFLSTRLSYKLNLKGPSITVQSACSTSLVAIHLARQSLLTQETDMALAGAISVRVPHQAGYLCDQGGIVSPDGKVRAFDAKANGTVFGSGGGIVALKRLQDAIADGDTIYAFIKGSAVNNDGSEKAGYTAPSVNSQADVVVEALTVGEVEADSIGYLEAHGSGTPVGDPIEVAALTKAFRVFTSRRSYCAIGSVKTNVGHLDAAAGIAGVIKTVLALQHRQLPPSINYTAPNPAIDFPSTPFYVNTSLKPWENGSSPRRAGIMSTGMGGTNAHLILEEAPLRKESSRSSLPSLITLSAKSADALDSSRERLAEFLQTTSAPDLADVAFTLQLGRKSHPFRKTFVGRDQGSAIESLSQPTTSNPVPASPRPIIFLLPGIGDHYAGMAQGLYREWPFFKDRIDECARLFELHLSADIRPIIFSANDSPTNPASGINLRKMLLGNNGSSARSQLNQTLFAHPAQFTIEYALARLWLELGVTPAAIAGHSMGEYVAACLAGVFSLADAIRLIAQRAKLVEPLPEAAMLAVLLPEAELASILPGELSISLVNSPNLCVIAGPQPAVAELEQLLGSKGIVSRKVQNTHPFHSHLLNPIIPEFTNELKTVAFHPPKIPFLSNLTGNWITNLEATNPSYWIEQTTRTARFGDALAQLAKFKDALLLEVGPGRTLGVLALQHPALKACAMTPLSSLRHHYENSPDIEFLYQNLGRLWEGGAEINWCELPDATDRHKVALPTYPLARERHWIDATALKSQPAKDLDKWFYVPAWRRTSLGGEPLVNTSREQPFWLLLGECSKLESRLKHLGLPTATACLGANDPVKSEDYVRLFSQFGSRSRTLNILHPATLGETGESLSGFKSLLVLARAVGESRISNNIRIGVVSCGLHDVTGEEELNPKLATILGPCGVIPKEFPNVACFNVDLPDHPANLGDDLLRSLLSEFESADLNRVVAYRGRYRWERAYGSVDLGRIAESNSVGPDRRLKYGGVYLITGGTGGIGLAIAEELARDFRPKLVLTRKTPFPERAQWEQILEREETTPRVRKTIRSLLQIERLGAEVNVAVADCSNKTQMQRTMEDAKRKFGVINGVIHSAGISKAGLIAAKSTEAMESVLAPKVQGAEILFELLHDSPLDFFVLFSSIASLLTPYAQADYSAANAFLDSFSAFANRTAKFHTLTINWPGWKEVGLLAELETPRGLEQWKQTELDRAISTRAGVAAFRRALNSDFNQVIISPENLTELIEDSRKPNAPQALLPQVAPAPESTRHATVAGNELESVVQCVWQEVLGIQEIALDDNFSDLGGHSLLAIKIVSELRKILDIELPLRALFDAPTIATLSIYIRERQTVPAASSYCAGNRIAEATEGLVEEMRQREPGLTIEDAFYLPHWFVQQTSWLKEPERSDSTAYNQVFHLQILGRVDRDALRESLHELVRRHQALRSLFRLAGNDLVQLVVSPQAPDLELVDLSKISNSQKEAHLRQIALEEASRPFDLEHETQLRLKVMRYAADHHIVQLTTHLLVHDDWSTSILGRELADLYLAFSRNEPSPLPELSFHYGDYVRWQEKRLNQSGDSSGKVTSRTLKDATARYYHLPTDLSRPTITTAKGARAQMTLTAALASSLNALGRREHVSLFMVLLAGFQTLLHRRSRDEVIGVGSCGANRPLAEAEGVVGRFGNSMLLRTDFTGNPDFQELLRRVRETALTAYSVQDIPFGAAATANGNGVGSFSPVFQVMFILQNAPTPNAQMPGLRLDWSKFYADTAAYDLDVFIKNEGKLEVTFEYKTDLFRQITIEQLLDDYRAILEEMVSNPHGSVGKIAGSLNGHERDFTGAVRRETSINQANIEATLLELWRAAFKNPAVAIDEDFFGLGGDSLLAARLFARIESVFGLDLPLSVLIEAPTIRKLAERISREKGDPPYRCLIPVQPNGTRPPLFCVHGHMGEIFYCRTLAETLGPEQPVFGLRSKRNGRRNHTIEEMASGYLREIRAAQPSGPYYLSGYCLGGMVAYEMARRLKDAGEEIGLLALFNTPAPGCLKGWPWRRGYLAKKIAHELKALRSLSFGEKLSRIGAKSSGFASLTVGVLKMALWNSLPILSVTTGRRQAQRFLSIGNINVAAAKTYQPLPYSGRIILFATSELSSLYSIDPSEGWNALAAEGVESHIVDGDNVSMFHPKFIATLGTALKSCLERAWIAENEVTSRNCFLNLEEPRPMGSESIAV